MTTEKQEKVYQISENYGVGADIYNIILFERFNKKDGRGRNANETGEQGWKHAKGGAYFKNINHLADFLKNKVEKEAVSNIGIDFDKFTKYMDEWLLDFKSCINKNDILKNLDKKG